MSAVARLYRPLWTASTYRASLYLLLGLFFGVLWFSLVITGYVVGIVTVIIWIGVPILALTHRSLRAIGAVERWQVKTLLGAHVEAPTPFVVAPDPHGDHSRASRFGNWLHAVFDDVASWRILTWVIGRAITGPVGFVIALTAWVVVPALVLAPALLLLGPPVVEMGGDAEPWWPWVAAGPLVALVVAPALAWSVRGMAGLDRMFGRWALGLCDREKSEIAIERAELAEQQVRIDQELHDSIGHMITMNIVQAGAGAHVFDSDPDFARQALKNIEERGRVAMSELDRIIATIRGDKPELRAPLPDVQSIPELLTAARAAGVDVTGVLEADAVPGPLSRAAYAVVREAVTNAAKHAPGSRVHVHVATLADAIGVAVTNTAGQQRPSAAGNVGSVDPRERRHGLAGIRDRVTLLGGYSTTGPSQDGGFEVMALLPLATKVTAEAPLVAPDGCSWDALRPVVTK